MSNFSRVEMDILNSTGVLMKFIFLYSNLPRLTWLTTIVDTQLNEKVLTSLADFSTMSIVIQHSLGFHTIHYDKVHAECSDVHRNQCLQWDKTACFQRNQ